METHDNKISRALIWTAGIAMILFFGAGTAAFMGWIPGSAGHTGDGAAISKPGQPPASPMSATTPAAPKPVIAKPAAPKPQSTAEYPKAPVAQAKCIDCGVIESTREVDTKGEGSGIGAVGGAVVGGVLGHQVGGGRGKDVATVIGAVGGVVAGNEIEKRMKSTKSYETTVRLDDGSTRVVRDATAPAWRTGDHVKLVDGVIRSN